MTLKACDIYIYILYRAARLLRAYLKKHKRRENKSNRFSRAREMCRPFPLKFGGNAMQSPLVRCSRGHSSLSLSLSHTHTRARSSSSRYSSSRSGTCKTCELVANPRVFPRVLPTLRERRRKELYRRRICLEGITYGTE